MPAVDEAMGDFLEGEPVVLLHPAVRESDARVFMHVKASLPWTAAENEKDISMHPFRLTFF